MNYNFQKLYIARKEYTSVKLIKNTLTEFPK